MRALSVLLACLASAGVFAGVVAKPEVTVELPDGWHEVPAGVLQSFHDEIRRKAPTVEAPKYDYAFQANAGPPWLAYPYVLVKIRPSGRPPESELANLPSIDLDSRVKEKGEDWSRLMKDSSLGQMRYDQAANVVWLTSKSAVVNIGEVRGISGIIPTEQGFVELHAYARTEDFDAHLPTFEKIIRGAKVAPDLVYRPTGADKPGFFAGFNLELIGFLAVLGALIAIGVVTMRRRRRREG
jgi:hypothetical protein